MSKTQELKNETALAVSTPKLPMAEQAQYRDPFRIYADDRSPQTIVGELLKFSKGEYFAGKEARPIPIGTKFIVALDDMMAGFVKWRIGKPVQHALVRVADGLKPPKREQLGDTDEDAWEFDSNGKPRDPWQEVNYILLADEQGNIFTFSISSISGIKEVAALCHAYAARRISDQGSFPIVAFDCGSYLHSDRSRGRIKYPELNIVGWASKEKFAQAMAAAGFTVPAVPSVPVTADEPIEAEEPPPHTEVPSSRDDDDEIPF